MSYKFKYTIINNKIYYKTDEYNATGDLVSPGEYELLNSDMSNKAWYSEFNSYCAVSAFIVLPYNNEDNSITWSYDSEEGVYTPSSSGTVPLHYKINLKANSTSYFEYIKNVVVNNCLFDRMDSNLLGLYDSSNTDVRYGWLNDDNKLLDSISILTIIVDPDDNTKYRLIQYIGHNGNTEIWREFKFVYESSGLRYDSPSWDKSWTDSYEQFIFERELSTYYQEIQDTLDNPTSSNNSLNFINTVYSYDVDSNGLLIDNLRELGKSVYYTIDATNNTVARNGDLCTLCEELPIYDVYNTSDGKVYQSNKVYVLFRVSKTTNGYDYDALYSPELFNEVGIGYLLSNWVVYRNGELKILWWPELSPNRFGTENVPPQLAQYSQENPLVGEIKCWKDARFFKQDSFEKDSHILADTKFYPNTDQRYKSTMATTKLPVDDTYVTEEGKIVATKVIRYQIKRKNEGLFGFNVGEYFSVLGTGGTPPYGVDYYANNYIPDTVTEENPVDVNDANYTPIQDVYAGYEFYWDGSYLRQLTTEKHELTEDHAYLYEQTKTFYVDDNSFRRDVNLTVEYRENDRICVLPRRETGTITSLTPAQSLNTYIDKNRIDVKYNQDKIVLFGYSNFLPLNDEDDYVINDKEPIKNLVMWKNINDRQEQLNLIDGINYHTDGLNIVTLRDGNNKIIVKYPRIKQFNVITTKWEKLSIRNYKQLYQHTKEEQLEYQPEIRIFSDSSEVDIDALIEGAKKSGLVTPSEYYAYNNTSFGGYNKIEYEEEKQNWFWLEDFKNWCIWKYDYDSSMYYLSIWNGFNGWDDLRDIYDLIKAPYWDYFYLAYRYFYPKYVFNLGPAYYLNGGLRLPANVNDVYQGIPSNNQQTYAYDKANNSLLQLNTLMLQNHSNYSTYDSYSFQSVRNSDYYPNTYRVPVIPGKGSISTYIPGRIIFTVDRDNGYIDTEKIVNPFTTQGSPSIIRTSNGQLNLLFAFKFDLDSTKDIKLIQDTVDDINNACITFFGTGNSKTIDDWKNFEHVSDTSEEVKSDIKGIDSETIYDRPSQVNSIADTINMNITFDSPRPNVVTTTTDDDNYAIRWNR